MSEAGPVKHVPPSDSLAEILEDLTKTLPGRRKQIEQLLKICDPEVGIAACNALFVYGTAATGKTRVISEVLRRVGHTHAIVNCIEACSQRILFEQLLNQLDVRSDMEKAMSPLKCESLHIFLLKLSQMLDNEHNKVQTTYLVFDNAENLRRLSGNVLASVLRISELVGKPICPILISGTIWEKFRSGTGLCEPYLLHFPAYSKDVTLRILEIDCPSNVDRAFFGRFCTLLWDVFHGPCRDLNELRHLVALLFPIYLRPTLDGSISKDNSSALYKNITPYLKKQLNKLYLRETSSVEWSATISESADDKDGRVKDIELPFISKHLLVAGYLASFNPASSDQRIFAKSQPRAKKKGGASKITKAKKEKLPQYLCGPKAFPLDRLLAILFSLLEISDVGTTEIFTQISSLSTLRMLIQVHTSDYLDAPKYKCLVSLNEIKKIAKSIDIDIGRYLYDGMTI